MNTHGANANCAGRWLQVGSTFYDLADANTCTWEGNKTYTVTFGDWVPPNQLVLSVDIMDFPDQFVQNWKNAKFNKYKK